MTETNQGADDPGAQQLTLSLAGEEYGIDILSVREIRGWSKVTRVPQTPAFILGVLNLRGAIVPVMDLRLRFGLQREAYTDTTVTVVVAVGERLFGMVVDAVSDVIELVRDDVKPLPDMGRAVDTKYLTGLITHNERMVMLLNVEKLMRPEELAALDAAMPAADEVEVAA